MRVSGIPYVQGRNAYLDADGTKYGIAIHNTSNDASAEGEASYAQRRPDGVSSHFYCDRDSVIQSLDTHDKAGHAGSTEGNQHAVAVEITGTNDKSRAWWLANVAWDRLGQVLAQVCRTYNIQVRRANVGEMDANPKVRAFYSHNDMRLAWGGTSHTDPGPNFPWDRLFAAVNAALNPVEADDMAVGDDIYHLLHDGRRPENLPQTAGGGTPIAWLPREIGEIQASLGELAALKTQLSALQADVAALAAKLEAGPGGITQEMLTEAIRTVMGSVDGATPQA